VDRDLVDEALAGGDSFREIGTRFGLALATIHRHAQHAQRAAVQALAEVPKAGERVLDQVDPLVSEAERLLSKWNGEGHGPQPPKPELLSDPPAPPKDAPDQSDQRSLAELEAPQGWFERGLARVAEARRLRIATFGR
jgi:hypothetical protein